jgi:hypothetical protein
MDRSASERKAKAPTSTGGGEGTPTRSVSVFKLPVLPLSDVTTTPNTAKKRKAHEKAKTPRDVAASSETPGNEGAAMLERATSSKKSRAAVPQTSTPHVTSMREATRLWATPTPTNTPLKPSASFAVDFEPAHGVPSFLLSDQHHKSFSASVPESPRHAMRASAMVDQAFQNPLGTEGKTNFFFKNFFLTDTFFLQMRSSS